MKGWRDGGMRNKGKKKGKHHWKVHKNLCRLLAVSCSLTVTTKAVITLPAALQYLRGLIQ